MADPFRVEPKGKSWADIVEEDEQSDLLSSQYEESDAALVDAHAVSATPSSDQQADSNKDSIAPQEYPPKVEDKPILTGSRASKWASAPSEPRGQSKWQSTSSSGSANASKGGSMASKWASAPDSPSHSRYDSNHHTRHDPYSRFGGNDNHYGRNTDLRHNNRWREDPPSGGRLNRSAFEDEDTRNGGFSNKANFSREKRYQEYHELTNKEVVKDEASEDKKAIESWNAYKPPAEENEETAKQLVKATNEVKLTSADQATKEEQQNVPIAQKENPKEIEVSPTEAAEPVKPTVSSSPSLKPVFSFSWADDIPDDNSDDDSDYPIPADWIRPKVATHTDTTKVEKAFATPQTAEIDIKEPAIDDLSTKPDLKAEADAKNSSPVEAKPELSQSSKDTGPENATTTTPSEATDATLPTEASKEKAHAYTWGALNDYKEPAITESNNADTTALNDKSPEKPQGPVQPAENDEPTTTATNEVTSAPSPASPARAPKKEAPTYTWGVLNDYKEPETTISKADTVVKIDKEQEEAAIAAWNSVTLLEEPEEKADTAIAEDEKPSWNQVTKEQQPLWSPNAVQEKPSSNQVNEEKPSWNQSTESSWNQPDKELPKAQQEPSSEPKPTYTWGALDDYKEPKVIAKPKPGVASISKEDEEAAISAWNSLKLPEVLELKKDKSQELVNDTPSLNSATQNPEPVKAEPSENATSVESLRNSDDQATSWGAVKQPSWSKPSVTAESITSQQQQQDWGSNSFQEGSSVTSKSSFKDTWRNKLPTNVDDNAVGWKSFAESVAVPPEPAPKQTEKKPADGLRQPTFKRSEKGSAASKWSHDRYNGTKLVQPEPSQKKPHDLSFRLNDFKEATNNEVFVSWKDIQVQDKPETSIKHDSSGRQVTSGLGEFSRANPEQDLVLRLSDITAGRPLGSAQQQQHQQHQGPQEVILNFSEFNKGRNGVSSTSTSSNQVPTASISDAPSSSGPKEIVCKLSDFGRKDKTDGPLDITFKLS